MALQYCGVGNEFEAGNMVLVQGTKSLPLMVCDIGTCILLVQCNNLMVVN